MRSPQRMILRAFREKYHGLLAEGKIGNEKVLLLKPQTFMNKSGVSVSEAVNFFKLDGSQIVVFYDELDLPPGKLRMRRGGGFAGHNGLKSINAHMGADFRRASWALAIRVTKPRSIIMCWAISPKPMPIG